VTRPRVTPTSDPAPGISRRTVLGGTAALCVGAPLLAACGSDDAGGDSDVQLPAAGTKLSTTAEVPVGGGIILVDEGLVVTQPEEGTFKAFSSKCTHQGCVVTKVTETIDCPCHNSKFSLSDGSPQSGPATSPLPETSVTVDGANVTTA
jgi:Rieske Fe-S protein